MVAKPELDAPSTVTVEANDNERVLGFGRDQVI
jgi:hypothetical protein